MTSRRFRWRVPILVAVLALFGGVAACGSPTNPRLPQPDEDREPGDRDRGDEQGLVVPSDSETGVIFFV